jgi:ATP-dependent Zn protease
VTQEDLIAALNQDGKTLSGDDRRRIAIHEAGHAVAMHQLGSAEVTSVTLVGQGGAGGTTWSRMSAQHVLTPALLETRLITLMGGRAAEAVLLGEISAGSGGIEGSDLCGATLLAAEAELSLGLGRQGLIWQMPPTARTVGEWLARRPDVAEAVRHRLDCAYERACELIRSRIGTVERLAETLLRHQALAGAELLRLLDDGDDDGDDGVPPDGGTLGNGSLSDGASSDDAPCDGAPDDGALLGSVPQDVAGTQNHHRRPTVAASRHRPTGQAQAPLPPGAPMLD